MLPRLCPGLSQRREVLSGTCRGEVVGWPAPCHGQGHRGWVFLRLYLGGAQGAGDVSLACRVGPVPPALSSWRGPLPGGLARPRPLPPPGAGSGTHVMTLLLSSPRPHGPRHPARGTRPPPPQRAAPPPRLHHARYRRPGRPGRSSGSPGFPRGGGGRGVSTGVAQACRTRVPGGLTRRSLWGARAFLACLEMKRGKKTPLPPLGGRRLLSTCCVLGSNPSALPHGAFLEKEVQLVRG